MDDQKQLLDERLKIASQRAKDLLDEICKIEEDTQAPAIERLSRVRKVREELNKVAQEIDSIKREFNLLTHYRIN